MKLIEKNGLFYPSEEIKRKAWVNSEEIYEKAFKDPVKFWEELANELSWFKKWDKAFVHEPPYFKWFVGGKINITYNIFERQLEKIKNKVAIIWEPEPLNERPRYYTYYQLYREVNKLANALKKLGVRKGDVVGIYLPMIPEVIISMLACARIGAIHSVVFSAFSPHALKIRLQETEAKILITADGYYRKGKLINLKKNADEGIKETKVEKVIVVKRAGNQIDWVEGRDIWYHELIKNESDECEPEVMDSEDILFILYTSGCVAPGTFIQLESGLILPIEEISKSKICSLDIDNLKSSSDYIKELHKYYWPLRLYRIVTSVSKLEVTPSHPIFVLDSDLKIREKEACNLEVNDVLLIPIPKPNVSLQKLPSLKYSKRDKNIPKLPHVLNETFAQFLGYFAGDGYATNNRIEITDKDLETLEFYRKLVENLGLKSKIVVRDRKRLQINSASFFKYLCNNFEEVVRKSKEREIPKSIQKSPSRVVAAFLRGLFDAEGSVCGCIKLTTLSKKLAYQTLLLLLRLGILANLEEEKIKTKFGNRSYERISYTIRIQSKDSISKFYSKIGFSHPTKKKRLEELIKKKSKGFSNIEILNISKFVRGIIKEFKISKKIARRFHLYEYANERRRIYRHNLSNFFCLFEWIEKQIKQLDLPSLISFLRIREDWIAKLTGYSKHTVHIYLRRRKLRRSKAVKRFFEKIKPIIEKIVNEKKNKIKEWKKRIEKILKADAFFVKIRKIERTEFTDRIIYDLTTLKENCYIANGIFVHNTTGKPKGILHTCGGYTVQAYWTAKWIFDLKDTDIFWSTADIGWITGHTYSCYGPLLNGATFLIYEGAPTYPTPDRWAQIIEKYGVTIFYTAPTAIRMFERFGGDLIKKYSFKTLRLLGSVGEPINKEAWLWFFKEVGKERCPIVDTWWQTETGGILLTSLPGIGPFKPTFAGRPFPGIKFDILDENGKSVETGKEGNLVILPPFAPGMLRGVYKNPERYKKTYWSQYGNTIYFTSDGAYRDENGLIRITGRVDDVLKVAGHRLSTAELEDAITRHPLVNECAIVGIPHEIKGEVPVAFVVLKEKAEVSEQEIIKQVEKEIGPIARPTRVYFVSDLPKTRSGKIMRRILKKIVIKDENLGDISTLANPQVVEEIKKIVG